MALCGDGSPITFHINFEHQQLLNRLEGVRYTTQDGKSQYVAVPERLRQAGIHELGQDMGAILAGIPSLNAELARSRVCSGRCKEAEFVHLRIVMSGSELAILPLELAQAPQAFPGEGLDLSLQGSLPVVMTREVRRSRPLDVSWDVKEPKVLIISAQPAGLTVPLQQHVLALRQALDPWIGWPDNSKSKADQSDFRKTDEEQLKELMEQQPLNCVMKRLRVLPGASVESIYRICAQENFTHIHILAHGDHYEEAGELRFGLALCADGNPHEKRVVSGQKLASAIRAEDQNGVSRSRPLVVTLATCDSGRQGSVLVPGGSIAHELHSCGIPWIFASQFPLTKAGSVEMTKFLYPRLMRGDDPRQVLYELRRVLSMTASREHDWASIVAYASVEDGFEHKVSSFLEKQTIKEIDVQMSRADNLVQLIAKDGSSVIEFDQSDEEPIISAEVNRLVNQSLDRARKILIRWVSRMPEGEKLSLQERTTRANCFGRKGSTLKRMALLNASMGDTEKAGVELEKAREAYRQAMEQWVTEEARFSWTASQYLSLSAVTNADRDKAEGVFAVCRHLAERDIDSSDRDIVAWAHATLAELDLLSLFFNHDVGDRVADVKLAVVEHCRKIVELMGHDSFHVQSTHRQFQRYAVAWRFDKAGETTRVWVEVAKTGMQALEE